MLQFPAEWVQVFGANLASAFPPQLGARFRLHERIWPQPSFSQLVQRALAADPDFRPQELGPMVRIVTVEGEYGAWIAVQGRREGGRAMRFLGAVFMEDFATLLDVIAVIPEHFSHVERLALELVRSQRFEMSRRPRRFFYVPPVGWHGIASGPIASWYPLDFPNNLSNIVVAPAGFLERDGDGAVETTFGEAGAGLTIDSSARDELVSASGIKGAVLRLAGKRAGRAEAIYRELAMFVVMPYAYRFRLETTNGAELLALREIFRGVAGSFRPLPTQDESRVGRAFSMTPDVFDHWTT